MKPYHLMSKNELLREVFVHIQQTRAQDWFSQLEAGKETFRLGLVLPEELVHAIEESCELDEPGLLYDLIGDEVLTFTHCTRCGEPMNPVHITRGEFVGQVLGVTCGHCSATETRQ